MEIETAVKWMTPKEGSSYIGIPAEVASEIKGLLISLWLRAEGELEWPATLEQIKVLLQRVAPSTKLDDRDNMLSAVKEALIAAFIGSPEQSPEDIARLRYQLRFVLKHGCLDVAEPDALSTEDTDPGR